MPNAPLHADEMLVRRLGEFMSPTAEEVVALRALCAGPARYLNSRADLISQGDRPSSAFLIASGWACRYKTLPDGRRQIVAFLLPGDLCDLRNDLVAAMDHSIGALSALSYIELSHEALDRVLREQPRVSRALWRQVLVGIAIQREWTLNLGQRNARERLAHLFCELHCRLLSVGLAGVHDYDLPLNQGDLADATGVSTVHVNRTLQQLRAAGLVHLRGRLLTIPDPEALRRAGLFASDYLHLGNVSPNRSADWVQPRRAS